MKSPEAAAAIRKADGGIGLVANSIGSTSGGGLGALDSFSAVLVPLLAVAATEVLDCRLVAVEIGRAHV